MRIIFEIGRSDECFVNEALWSYFECVGEISKPTLETLPDILEEYGPREWQEMDCDEIEVRIVDEEFVQAMINDFWGQAYYSDGEEDEPNTEN